VHGAGGGRCPIHGESGRGGRTFSVHPGKGVYQCFHPPCASHGNVLDLWAAVHKLPLREAALHLAATFNLEGAGSREEEPVQGGVEAGMASSPCCEHHAP
jgi:DNA primase